MAAPPCRRWLAVLFLPALATLASGVSAQTAAPPPTAAAVRGGPGSLAGLWTNARYKWSSGFPARERTVATVDGKAPPLQRWAADLLAERIKASDDGKPFANSISKCLPGGVPSMMYGAASYPLQIVETGSQVIILFDEQNHFRLINLDREHKADADPSYMGDSVGRWDGDTLVIDTVALNDKTTLDPVGTPHTDKLHVVERLRRSGADTLEDLITVEDVGTFTRPWQTRAYLKRPAKDIGMAEYICEPGK